ncbi:MAG: carbon-nitrogen hydrolase family protein [Duganella sp.]
MSIRIAAAQTASVPGDLDANIRTHVRFIDAARAEGVQILVFPELSLSGYELPLLRQCALTADDVRLAPLRAAASAAGMTVIVGAPLIDQGAAQPCIGSITFAGQHQAGSDALPGTYRKQYLHAGEEVYAQPGPRGASAHALHGQRYVEAICADISRAAHAQAAADAGASLYLAGALISVQGYATDAGLLQQYASTHGFGVLLANHGAPSGGYSVAGQSAFWAPGGMLVAQVPGVGDYLLVAELAAPADGSHAADWRGSVVPVAA